MGNTPDMRHGIPANRIRRTGPQLSLALLATSMAGCSVSFSSGGVDYEKLESTIAEKLNGTYAAISQQVSGVDCPRQAETPKTGDSFVCNADIDGQTVRVKVDVKDDDYNVDYSTLDVVYDLPTTGDGLSRRISDHYGFPVSVTCGEGIKVVEIGQSFDCKAMDQDGATRTVRLTAGDLGEDDRWEVIDE